MTFNSLQEDARNYTERAGAQTDPTFATQLPNMINLVERQIARELKIQGFQNYVTFPLASGVDVYEKPDRWRETISINIGTVATTDYNKRVMLLPRSYEYVRTVFPDATTFAQPKVYADYGYNNIVIADCPDYSYPCEWAYWELPALLDDENTQNWLTDYAPNALLHGTLVECFKFLKKPDEAAAWQQTFDRDMASLAGEDLQKILDRAQERHTS